MLNFSYSSVLPLNHDYFSLLNTFVLSINKPQLLEDTVYFSEKSLAKCENCKVILTELTYSALLSQCVMCGLPRNSKEIPEKIIIDPITFIKKQNFIEKPKISFLDKIPVIIQEKIVKTCYISQNKEIFNPEIYLVVLIDTSASMNTAYLQKETKNLKKPIFKSRLTICFESLRIALEKLVQSSNGANYKLCLITFNEKITIFGDLFNKSLSFEDKDKCFNDFDLCFQYVKGKCDNICLRNLGDSLEKLKNMEEFNKDSKEFENLFGNTTALGPALAMALGILEEFPAKNSQIVVFTDRYANEGFLQFGGLEELLEQSLSFYQEAKIFVMLEIKKIKKKARKLNTSINIFGFEENIGVEFLSEMIGSSGFLYKAKVKKEKIGIKEEASILDIEEFNEKLSELLMKFESLLGINAFLKVYLSSNMNLIDRNLKVNSSHITQGEYYAILNEDIGYLWDSELSFSYKILDFDEKNTRIHLELSFETLEKQKNQGFLKNLTTYVFEKKLFVCENTEFLVKSIEFNTLKKGFYLQKLFFAENEVDNMMVLLIEAGLRDNYDEFRNDLQLLGLKEFLKTDALYQENAKKKAEMREILKKNQNNTKNQENKLFMDIGTFVKKDRPKVLMCQNFSSMSENLENSFLCEPPEELKEDEKKEETITNRNNILNNKNMKKKIKF